MRIGSDEIKKTNVCRVGAIAEQVRKYIEFEVIAAVTVKSTIWNVAPCTPVQVHFLKNLSQYIPAKHSTGLHGVTS
jgi:hypothetical protein